MVDIIKLLDARGGSLGGDVAAALAVQVGALRRDVGQDLMDETADIAVTLERVDRELAAIAAVLALAART